MKLSARLPSIARRTLGRHSLALALFAVPLVSGTNLGGLSGVHSLSGGQSASDWLAPGKPTLTLEAADEMANAALSEVSLAPSPSALRISLQHPSRWASPRLTTPPVSYVSAVQSQGL
jgi:hypothetical protein